MKNKKKLKMRARGRTAEGTHVPVLVKDILKVLSPQKGEIVADCTLGFGGHAARFIDCIGPDGKLVGMDVDGRHLKATSRKLAFQKAATSFHHANFSSIKSIAEKEGDGGFDILFADLGISSMQVDDAGRGVSYKNDGPLDMRMDERLEKTGADILAEFSAEQLSDILWRYSDEPDHEIIAEFIVGQRISKPITRVSELVRLVMNAKGLTEKTFKKQNKNASFGSAHPAARTFQAVRIAVNGEMEALEKLLADGPQCLRPDGRIGIMSFQSGEDRLVKEAFRKGLEDGVFREISPKPIVPDKWEIMKNPRSSSARFRWARACCP